MVVAVVAVAVLGVVAGEVVVELEDPVAGVAIELVPIRILIGEMVEVLELAMVVMAGLFCRHPDQVGLDVDKWGDSEVSVGLDHLVAQDLVQIRQVLVGGALLVMPLVWTRTGSNEQRGQMWSL